MAVNVCFLNAILYAENPDTIKISWVRNKGQRKTLAKLKTLVYKRQPL